ncbi:MAG: peptidase M29 [Pseudomonadota bacterium]|nr:peptidase M29 [Pseudomonadota bacterium]
MLTDRIESKWIDSFSRVFDLCGVEQSTLVGIVSESQSRAVSVHLAELACHRLGAVFHHIILPTPPQSAPVPVRSTGATMALTGQSAAVASLRACEVVIDLTVEGMVHAEELFEIQSEGARLMMISNEHPEVLERLEPDPGLEQVVDLGISLLKKAKTMKVTSAAGTDLTIDVTDAPTGGTPGFTRARSGVAHWPGGLCLCFPQEGTINGKIVMAPGDMNLTFKRYLEHSIVLQVEDDYLTGIEGDNLDADLFRSYLAAWDDPVAYGFSHVGWGLNPRARWESLVCYDRGDIHCTEFRAFAGNFLFSTGSNQEAGRFTQGHFDLPLRNCSISLDGLEVVDRGMLSGPFSQAV